MRTTPPAVLLTKVIEELEDKRKSPLLILETGCVRDISPEFLIGDGHSTFYIARLIAEAEYPHAFFSIDLNTSVAAMAISKKKLAAYVSLLEGDSRVILKEFFIGEQIKFDLVYLDSSDEPDIVFEEFKLLEDRMRKGGYIIIDDICEETKKGDLVLPHIVTKGYKTVQEDRMLLVEF